MNSNLLAKALRDLAYAVEMEDQPTSKAIQDGEKRLQRPRTINHQPQIHRHHGSQVEVLTAVAANPGGRVSKEEMARIALAHGYDPRGMAGWYTANSALLRMDGNFRVITAKGRKRLNGQVATAS